MYLNIINQSWVDTDFIQFHRPVGACCCRMLCSSMGATENSFTLRLAAITSGAKSLSTETEARLQNLMSE